MFVDKIVEEYRGTEPTPVSYTHLDVYKRQALNHVENYTYNNTPGIKHSPDVYKRQVYIYLEIISMVEILT